MATKAFKVVNYAVNEPIITGGLLWILTRGPPQLRERILRPFTNNLLATNAAGKLVTAITILKTLTGLGILKRISQALDRFALNGWAIKRKGEPFRFGLAKKEVIVITGGSSGFGYEMVKSFSQHATVIALDVSPFPPELERLHGVHFYRCDVTDTPAVQAVCEEIRQKHGDPTVLINNAGIANGKPVLDTTNEQTEKLFQVNLISHFTLIREFLPGMLRKKKGHIVTIASMASFVAAPGLLDYCCSKVAALYLNDGLRGELLSRYQGGEAICTTSVHPSWHDTAILKVAGAALKKSGTRIDPATNVSDKVVEQVLKGKTGRLYIPSSHEYQSLLRVQPLWLQDLVFGLHRGNKSKRFKFGKDEETAVKVAE